MMDNKKKKAALIAVAYYLEEEAAKQDMVMKNMWDTMGRKTIMNNRLAVQRQGKSLPLR